GRQENRAVQGFLPHGRRPPRPPVMRRLLIGVGEREQARIGPRAAEERDAERVPTVADEPAGDGHLRQTGERALLTAARLAAEAREAALVRVRPRQVRRIEERVEPLIVHQADEELAERVAARDELVARLAELVAGWNRRDGDLEAARAVGRELARGQQLLDRDHLLA